MNDSVSDLVTEWLERPSELAKDGNGFDTNEDALRDLIRNDPDRALAFVLEACGRELSGKQIAYLAAGPLEDLLCHHGRALIDRVETKARQNPKFRYLLAGVWRNRIDPEVWSRVIRFRSS